MIYGRLYRADNRICIIPEGWRTVTILDRMRGLLGQAALTPDQGLLINPCSSVHTVGMGYAIDLVFLDRGGTIIKTVCGLRPWRMAICPGAAMVLELAEGSVKRLQLNTALQLVWEDENPLASL